MFTFHDLNFFFQATVSGRLTIFNQSRFSETVHIKVAWGDSYASDIFAAKKLSR